MSDSQTPFQDCRTLLREGFAALGESQEYRLASNRSEEFLTLADRVLAASQSNDSLWGLSSAVASKLANLKIDEAGLTASMELAGEWEKWCKAIIWLALPDVWAQRDDQGTGREPTLVDDLITLGFYSAKLLEKANKEKQGQPNDEHLQIELKLITEPVLQCLVITQHTRRRDTHGGRTPREIEREQPRSVLAAFLAPLVKYESKVRERLLGLVPQPFTSGTGLAQRVNNERTYHLERFKGRKQQLMELKRRLQQGCPGGRGYILVSAPERLGKSALVSQLTEELMPSAGGLGIGLASAQQNAPWLPGAIVHFGKNENRSREIVQFLLEQINCLLLVPRPVLPEVDRFRESNSKFLRLYGSSESIRSPMRSSRPTRWRPSIDDTKEEWWDGTGHAAFGSRHATFTPALQERFDDDLEFAATDRLESPSEETECGLYQRHLSDALGQLAVERGHSVIIIDACDEIDPEGRGLEFLPDVLPAGILVLLTCRENSRAEADIRDRLRPIQQFSLKPLSDGDVALVTGVDDTGWNRCVAEKTRGLPFLVQEVRNRLLARDDGDYSKVDIESHEERIFERQAEAWTDPENEHVETILWFLAMFERISPLPLQDIQAFLRHQGVQRLTKPELKRLLKQNRRAEQLTGSTSDAVKLNVQSFADYLCEKHYSEFDLQVYLETISDWLAGNDRVDSDRVFGFLRAWGLPENEPNEFLRETAISLCDRIADQKNWRVLTDSAGLLMDEGESGQLLAKRCLETAATGEDTHAMNCLGGYLIQGDVLEKNVIEGRIWLMKSAERGDTSAMGILGSRQLVGIEGIERDTREGLRWLTKSAEAGHTQAMLCIGAHLLNGNFLEQDITEGRRWLVKAAEAGDTCAMGFLGERLLDGDVLEQDSEEGLRWLTMAAESGDEDAMWLLGNGLLDGDVLERNITEGHSWLVKAAEAGDTCAMGSLGERLLDGDVLEQDTTEGRKWLVRSAEASLTYAMFRLGVRLLDGIGVEQNTEEGFRWLTKAAEAAEATAMGFLGHRLLDGTGVEQNTEEGLRWLTKAVEAGNTHSMWILGYQLIAGDQLPMDIQQGREWLEKSAEAGTTGAMVSLGLHLTASSNTSNDTQNGIEWLRKAAQANELSAMVHLSSFLIDGNKCPRDVPTGVKWLQKAAEAGDPQAMKTLGFRLRYGEGLTQDVQKGREWLEKAKEAGEIEIRIAPEGMVTLGHTDYKEGDHRAAAETFTVVMDSEDSTHEDKGLAAINLFFMQRRGEVPADLSTPSGDVLLSIAQAYGPAGFVLINMALRQAGGSLGFNVDWHSADDSIAGLKESWEDGILDWWKDLADSDDSQDRGEGNLILGWLVRHGIIQDPDGLSVHKRMNVAKKHGWNVPEWLAGSVLDDSGS